MHKLLVAVLTCCVYLGASALQLPAYIHKCSITDPNFNTCALNSAKEALSHLITGDRENLIPILDPLFVSELTFNDGKVNAVYRNATIRGLKDLALESMSFDFDNKNITVEGRLPALNFIGNYEISGRVMEHYISGNGHCNVTYCERENLVPILDPLFVSEFTFNDGKVNVVCRNTTIRGLKDLALEGMSFDFNNKNITVEGRLPALNFDGNYELSGRLVEHYISGNGHFHLTFHDNSVKYTTSYDLNTHDYGQVYLVLQSYHLDLQPANFTVQLDNLFNGNKVLGDEMNKHINDNWRAVLDQVGPKAYEALGLIIHKILREAATLVPYKDIFNETE